MRPLLPPLTALRVPLRETGAGGLALNGPPSVPTQAKRDADGLAVDARTFLSDARAVVARVDNEPVFEPELAEEAQLLVERGAQLATNALAVEEGDRSALQAAVDELRAALARLEALPRRVTLDAVGEAIKAVRDAMRQQYAGANLTPAAREEIRRQAREAERLVEARLRYLEAVGSNPQTTIAMLEGLRDAVRRFEQPTDDPLTAAAVQLEETQAPEEPDAAPTPDEGGGAPELPATQLEEEVPDESRSGQRLGALRDEVVAFLRAVRAGTISGASGGTQLARLRARAAVFPSGPLQAALLDALALAQAALDADDAPSAPPEAPAAPAPPPVAPAAPAAPEAPATPPPPPPPPLDARDTRDDQPMDVDDARQGAGGEEDEGGPGGREEAARRGSDPAEPEDRAAPRIVGSCQRGSARRRW